MYKNRLKQLRERMGITQKDVADNLGIETSHYGHIENEHEIISLKHLIAICNFFNVSLDYILELSNEIQYNNVTNEIDKMVVGVRLKEFRKEQKLTQVKLANLLNTVHPVITNYEKGKHLIATPFLYSICVKYHISADYLLGRIDTPKYLK